MAVADCPCEDGPRLQPLPIAKSRGERSRTFPCKHTPVQLAFDGFDLLYRLWTLPYNFLARIICATFSVIARRRRRASPVRADNPAAPTRYAAARWVCTPLPSRCSAGFAVDTFKLALRKPWEAVGEVTATGHGLTEAREDR